MELNKKQPEFDEYAHSYSALLDDPIRNRFAVDPLHFHRRKQAVLRRMLKAAGRTADSMRWLDVGCGQGVLLSLLGGGFAEAIGCDPSAGMLASNLAFNRVEQPSPVELPFKDGSFNLVTAVCVYHHVLGKDRTLLTGEIQRVLAPGGLCCIFEHNPWNPVTRAIVKRCPVDVGAQLLSVLELGKLFQSLGFRAVRSEHFLYLPEKAFAAVGPMERLLAKVPLGGQYATIFKRIQ